SQARRAVPAGGREQIAGMLGEDEGGLGFGGQMLTALELLDEGVIALDEQLEVVGANESALRILGLDRDALDQPGWWDRVRPRRPDGSTPELPEIFRRRARDVTVRIRRARDGRARVLLVHHQPLDDGIVIAFRDCTEERRTRERLEA